MNPRMERFQAGAYWTSRKESAEACARRAETCFRLLAACDPAYARWFEYAYSRKNALQLPFEPTLATFRRFFGRKKYRLGRDGFCFEAWTGQEQRGKGGQLSLTCGSGLPFYSNGCLLHLPREEPAAGRVLSVGVLQNVMRALAVAWEPDACAVVAEEDLAARKLLEGGTPSVSWLMYFPHHLGRLPALPRPVRVSPVEDQGSLVVLTPERFRWNDPAHLELAGRVRARLEKAGLLRPPASG